MYLIGNLAKRDRWRSVPEAVRTQNMPSMIERGAGK
jgi:hypothetical protein